MIIFAFFQLSRKCFLAIYFLLDITVITAFVCNSINGQRSLDSRTICPVHTVALPFYLITQPLNNTERRVVFRVGGMCPSTHFQIADLAAVCLRKSKHFYSIFVGLSFDINTKEYTPSKWAYCLIESQLFFWCVDVMSVSPTGRILNSGS